MVRGWPRHKKRKPEPEPQPQTSPPKDPQPEPEPDEAPPEKKQRIIFLKKATEPIIIETGIEIVPPQEPIEPDSDSDDETDGMYDASINLSRFHTVTELDNYYKKMKFYHETLLISVIRKHLMDVIDADKKATWFEYICDVIEDILSTKIYPIPPDRPADFISCVRFMSLFKLFLIMRDLGGIQQFNKRIPIGNNVLTHHFLVDLISERTNIFLDEHPALLFNIKQELNTRRASK